MPTADQGLDVLFVTEKCLWPLDQGFRIRGFHMARALSDLGSRVAVASMRALPSDAPEQLRSWSVEWPSASDEHIRRFRRGWSGVARSVRRRLADHQGVDPDRLAGIVSLIDRYRPKAVIGLGQHSPLMLAGLSNEPNIKTVWYAADELVSFQTSCLRRDPFSDLRGRLRKIALYLTLERLFLQRIDGAIGVTPRDAHLLRKIGGARTTVCIPNGVDQRYFAPAADGLTSEDPQSVVFWGRMDFEPNIDAVQWFAQNVWKRLSHQFNDAKWWIVGKNPAPGVRGLAGLPGVEVMGEVADVRTYARRAAVTVLPMRCGGGIKNKLLEAAAMGRPIVASRRSLNGLNYTGETLPIQVCSRPQQWVATIDRLWSDQASREQIGQDAATWVRANHDWAQAARHLRDWIRTLPRRGSSKQSPAPAIPSDRRSIHTTGYRPLTEDDPPLSRGLDLIAPNGTLPNPTADNTRRAA